MQKSLLTMLATQVPLIEVRAAQALFRESLQPTLGEPDSRRKVRQALAPAPR
ncbi:MAG: hypothetical protein M5U12_38075 [Verrucomicrobia bacterium]|nr:hypothetical protein [Verrucomicrobiota bacterium]